MHAFFARLDRDGERWLMLVLYTVVVAVIAIEVIRRFALSYSSIWGEEVARYCFIYLVWIGAAVAVRERSHIRIDVLLHFLPPRGRALLNLFGNGATLLLACLALYWSFEPILTSLRFGSVTHGLRISQAWFFAAVPFGFTLIVYRVLRAIADDLRDLRSGARIRAGATLFE